MAKLKSETSKIPKNFTKSSAYSTGTIIWMYAIGIAIRFWLILSRYQKIIGNHVEVSTPLNSWKRVLEGLYLQSQSVNPYEGDLLHEAPVVLLFYKTLTQIGLSVEIIFVIVDACTAVMLYLIARRYTYQLFLEQERSSEQYAEDSEEYLLSGSDYINPPALVAAAFLFNPYTIFNCVGLSTMVFHNLFLSIFLLSMLHGQLIISTLTLAICSVMSLYPLVLILPLSLNFYMIFRSKISTYISVVLFFSNVAFLIYVCNQLSGGNNFIKNVYSFILMVPDLQPNIGLFWYFFTEMFDHFRDLFIYSFQINATILYLIPLSIKFRKDPFLLTFAALFLISIFKSYPCVGDIGFVLSLLPCFLHLFNYSQQGFLVGVIFLITSALAPILWHLWIYCNSANANFYFGVTLAFAIAQIFLITDILFAYLKREFCLMNGKNRKINDKEATLVLE